MAQTTVAAPPRTKAKSKTTKEQFARLNRWQLPRRRDIEARLAAIWAIPTPELAEAWLPDALYVDLVDWWNRQSAETRQQRALACRQTGHERITSSLGRVCRRCCDLVLD